MKIFLETDMAAMPESCATCPFCGDYIRDCGDNYQTDTECGAGWISESWDKRPKSCPLREIMDREAK